MKVLSLSHSDSIGGAARAAVRIFEALNKDEVEMTMLVKHKNSTNENILEADKFHHGLEHKIDILKTKIENKIYKHKIRRYDVNEKKFISNLSSISLKNAFQNIDFDILHLHWVSHEFLDLNELKKIKKPIVWTLHDCWAFTGICHYFDNCERYTSTCGCCPILNSTNENDLSSEIWKKKTNAYKDCNIHVITPSKWLGECAAKSSLFGKFPLSVIPYPIDTEKFKPLNKSVAGLKLGLNPNKKYILFGAMNATQDERKGFHFFSKSFELLKNVACKDTEILIFGSKNEEIDYINGYYVNYLGNIEDDSQLLYAYCFASVVVVPSISENLSLVIMESLSCGTPVVAFNIGGNSDMIDHQKNGYLALPYSIEDLANGIKWCLEHEKNLSVDARKKCLENFSKDIVAEQYLKLFKQLC